MMRSFRRWWRPPRRISEHERERRVTFLELFYDLVYVVVIAEVGHALASHVNPRGLAEFVFLFALVWLAWVNGSWYNDRHGNNDIRTRVFTFVQMFTVAAMAIFAYSAFGAGAVGFALSFATYQLTLTYLWWRTGVHDSAHRPLSQPYALIFLVSTLLFVISAFVPPPWRFYLWGIGLVLSMVSPLIVATLRPSDPNVQTEFARSMTIGPSAVERFDLFTIIVLGEVIVSVVRGVAGHVAVGPDVGASAVLGMLIAVALWWLYFDFVAQRKPKATSGWTLAWLYLHLFITMGIVATGAATLNVLEHAGEALPGEVRWLLVGAVAVALATIALLMYSLQMTEDLRRLYRRAALITLGSALVVALLGFSDLATNPLLAILNLLMLLPVFYGVKVWIVVFGAEEIAIAE